MSRDVIPEIGDLERWTVFSLGDGHNFSRAFGHCSLSTGILAWLETEIF